MVNSRSARLTSRTAPSKTVHKIKIALRESRPPIWRRLEVPSAITLRELHDVIQAAFGWENYHMWAFESGRDRYGVADRDLGIRSATSKRLDQVAAQIGDRLRYTYDFGDDWEHDILTEDVTEPEPDTAYPRCLTGRRACPPEDCGGIWGYDYLIEILADPNHEEHEDRLEWLGLDSADQFDPAAFNAAEVNTALSALATVLVKN
ncbi:plasmid pRiA4b ORF-3 family protein [Actinacidiphila glaucinigra]